MIGQPIQIQYYDCCLIGRPIEGLVLKLCKKFTKYVQKNIPNKKNGL